MPRDAGEFLCESCGYSLAGVAMRTACPECGREAALSDGARRAGSPWQQRPSPRAWLVTNARTLASPRRIWDDVRISAPSTGWLLAANLGVSAGIVALALAQGGRLQAAPPLQHLVAFFVVAASIFAGFTGIEYSGLRAFGHRRAWRTTRAVALAACAHASVGWLVGAVLLAAVWTAAQQDVVPWLSGAAASPQSRWSAWGRPLAAMGVALASGMVVFSLLAGAGWSRLRFANLPSARPSDAPHDPGDPDRPGALSRGSPGSSTTSE